MAVWWGRRVLGEKLDIGEKLHGRLAGKRVRREFSGM